MDFECRETLAGVSALSSLVYGQAGKSFPPQVLASLRRHALQGIWHGAGNLSCAEVAFTLFLKGHRVDPVQALDFSCLVTLRRILSGNSTCRNLAEQIWAATSEISWRHLEVCGPITRALTVFKSLGWHWNSFDSVCTHNHVQLQLFHIDKKSHGWPDLTSFRHAVRDGLRNREWKNASRRRRDMAEISNGIERDIMTALHSDKANLTEYQRACLRAIVCGGVNTSGRHSLHTSRGRTAGVCPHCGSDDGESVYHRWWSCKAWQHFRTPVLANLPAGPAEMPTCLAECGILPCALWQSVFQMGWPCHTNPTNDDEYFVCLLCANQTE